jgi:hypothetical protein
MIGLIDIPLVLVDLIKEYVIRPTIEEEVSSKIPRKDLQPWRNFCNCCKSFNELKRLFCCYDLNYVYSLVYITLFEENISFLPASYLEADFFNMRRDINQMLLSIHSSRSQIILRLKRFEKTIVKELNEEFFMKYSSQFESVYGVEVHCWIPLSHRLTCFNSLPYVAIHRAQLKKLFPLENAKVVSLVTSCAGTTDYSGLSHCEEVNLSGASDLKNLLCLSKVKKLCLSYTDVSDVSCLSGVRYLDLSFCSNVIDVSMLGNCHTLLLGFCSEITDISALGNVVILNIYGLRRLQHGLPYDNKVKKLRCCPFYREKFYNTEKRNDV